MPPNPLKPSTLTFFYVHFNINMDGGDEMAKSNK